MVVDYWAHRHADDPKLDAEETFDDDFEATLREMEAKAGIPPGGDGDMEPPVTEHF